MTGRTGILGALSIIVFWMSCNVVMEDRRECPCNLSVQMKGLPASPALLYVNGSVAGKAYGDTTLTVWVEGGGTASVTVVAGAVPSSDRVVWIPYGEASTPLYVFGAEVDCTGESAFVQARLQKQFCTLNLYFKGLTEGDVTEGAQPSVAKMIADAPCGFAPSVNNSQPFSVSIRGSVNGYSLVEGKPLPGAFRCCVEGTSVRLPRQNPGDPLWLDLVMQDSVLRSFPLGTYLEEAGYDWTALDLPDRDLEIDISVSSIRFQTGTWSTVRELNWVI